MPGANFYQSDLIPGTEHWAPLGYSEEMCADAIGRAQESLNKPDAVRDINRRLGINVDRIPATYGIVGRIDANGNEIGHPKYPAFEMHSSVCEYLWLNPNNQELEFLWTLGVFNDQLLGPIPVLFLVSRMYGETRCVALVWSFAKERDREHFGHLLNGRIGEEIMERGMEGGFAFIYQAGFVVDGQAGGLDIHCGQYMIPWKTWNTLALSIFNNAVASEFTKTAMPWPYPTDMSADGIFQSPASSSAPNWY